jgi:hypothetical protein
MGAIEQELQAERVAALARIAARFETALGVWNALEAGTLPPLSSLRAQVARRLELRDAAAEALWMLLVQRETVGLRDHRASWKRCPAEIRSGSRHGGTLHVEPEPISASMNRFTPGAPVSSRRSASPGPSLEAEAEERAAAPLQRHPPGQPSQPNIRAFSSKA